MAVYKVIQDVEAEDKLLGPLGIRQFIYAAVAALIIFMDFRLVISGFGPLKWIFILIMLPALVLFGVLASPLGREQPTEVWLLSRIRFILKPRRRLWDQSGITHTVTITVPKKEARQLTNNLSQSEVHSRLEALAQTLDSRGWAVKNVNVNLNIAPEYLHNRQAATDRLVDTSVLPQEVPTVSVDASDDILDEQNNPTAHHFQVLMEQADEARRKTLMDRLKPSDADEPKPDFGFLNGVPDDSGSSQFFTKEVISPGETRRDTKEQPSSPTEKEQERRLLEHIHHLDRTVHKDHHDVHEYKKQKAKKTAAAHKHTQRSDPVTANAPTVTRPSQADKLELIQAAKHDKVSTLATLANRKGHIQQTGPDEVVISLH